MRLVTCIGSISSGKTCLLNILQEQAKDGKCFSIEAQNEFRALQEEFNHKPMKEIATQTNVHSNIPEKTKSKIERFKVSNKVAPNNDQALTSSLKTNKRIVTLSSDIKQPPAPDTSPILDSSLIGKTAPTVGVNHFEFIVDDLTLQVAGEYWQRKKKHGNGLCSNIKCRSTSANCDRIDAIELRELGGQIGE